MRGALLPLLLMLAACGEGGNEAAPAEAPADTPAVVKAGIDRSKAGTPAPDTAFEDPDGEPASLADFRGKPLLVNLWATWCAPCIAELPTLDALAQREGDKLQVLTISQDLDGREKIEAFFGERGYKALDTWLDPDMELMGALGVSQLPTTILYDAQGREVWRYLGDEDWTSAEAKALIAEAAEG